MDSKGMVYHSSLQNRVLKADLMAELDKEVKSLEEDRWMFEGPRSRIHLISIRDMQTEIG